MMRGIAFGAMIYFAILALHTDGFGIDFYIRVILADTCGFLYIVLGDE